MLRDAELVSLRATATASLPGTGTIRRRTAAADSQGGETWTWADLETYACRLAPRDRREQEAEGRLAAVTRWQLLLPYGAAVTATDRVRIEGGDYEVTETEPPRQEAIFTEATVVRVS